MNNKFMRLLPMGKALRHALFHGYQLKDFNDDLSAAFVVSLIALPLSMALAIAIGLPPQHGIITAIVAGFIASYFGGSAFQISGPTAAFVVILIPIVTQMGLHGLIWCQLLAGIFLVLFSIFKFGKFIHFVPPSVIVGFTSAIAIVIASISFKDFFALPSGEISNSFINKVQILFQYLPELSIQNTLVGGTTLFLVVLTKDKIKWLPSPIIGIIAGAILGSILQHLNYPIYTIGTEFHSMINGKEVIGIPSMLPTFTLPTISDGKLLTIPSLNELHILMMPALLISALAALESLLSAAIADNLTKTKHDPNAELYGIGLANVFSAMASGIPATAAIARTATNIQNGAKSPIAGMLHAILVLCYILIFAPLLNLIPMSSLAALLLVTAFRMSHLKEFWHILRTTYLYDKVVLLSTFIFTLLIDMVMGIGIGMALVMLNFSVSKFKNRARVEN